MNKQRCFIIILFSTTFMFAQKAKIKQGNWENLKGITGFNLVFDYSNLEIPNYESEEAFLKDKMQLREKKNKVMVNVLKNCGLQTGKIDMNLGLLNILTPTLKKKIFGLTKI